MILNNFDQLFQLVVQNLDCRSDTQSYISGIFTKFKSKNENLAGNSLTLYFADARKNHDFYQFQKLGDWIFFCGSIFPEHLKCASSEYYDAIAQNSFYSCFKLINKKWILFEELADNFHNLKLQTQSNFNKQISLENNRGLVFV